MKDILLLKICTVKYFKLKNFNIILTYLFTISYNNIKLY